MKLLHLAYSLSGGGAERALVGQSLGLAAKSDWSVVVVNISGKGVYKESLTQAGIRVIDLNRKKSEILLVLKDLISIRRSEAPDVVQSWMYFSDFVASLAFLGCCPVIWGVRNSEPEASSSAARKLFILILGVMSHVFPKMIIAVSEAGMRVHSKSYFFARRKFVVVPNFTDVIRSSLTSRSRKKIRSDLRVRDNQFLVGSVSRLHPAKGHDFLVNSALKVLEKDDTIVFCVVGIDDADSYLDKFDIPRSFHGNFRVLGFQQEIGPYFGAFDLFFLHSATEGFPNVLLEAIMLHCPVIATDVGDVREIVGEGDEVILSYGDVPCAVRKILGAKKLTDWQHVAQLGAHAHKRFSKSAILRNLDLIYKEALRK